MRIVEAAVEAGVAESRLIRKPLIFCARSCSGYGCSFTQKMDSFLNEKRQFELWGFFASFNTKSGNYRIDVAHKTISHISPLV